MWLFKKRRKDKLNPGQDIVGGKIGRGIIKLQTRFAERINVAVAKLSARKMKKVVVLFYLVSGGFSIYLAVNGVLGSNSKKNTITIDQTSVPKHFDKSGDEIKDVQNIVDEDLYDQVKTFKDYMDSLKRNYTTVYDSIMLLRPGLMDSINTIEEIYLSQKIK